MADQALAQTGALKDPFNPQPNANRKYTLRYKLAWRWQVARVWTRYGLIGRNRGVASLVDFIFGNHYFGAFQVRSELESLGKILAERSPLRALEIGTARGGTLFFLTRLANPKATIISLDLPGGRFGGGYSSRRRWFYQRFARRQQKLHLLQGDSHSAEMLERVKCVIAGQPLDYLFIDGDHRYEGVKSDFERYAPMVRKGGLIAFHDIAEGSPDLVGGVPQFWCEVKSHFRHMEIIEDREQGGFGIGILYVD